MRVVVVLAAAAALLGCVACTAASAESDLLLRGALVVDGTGAAPRVADVAVDDGRISYIGTSSLRNATVELDLSGLVLTPGFIALRPSVPVDCPAQRECSESLAAAGITTLVTPVPLPVAPSALAKTTRSLRSEPLFVNAGLLVSAAEISPDAGPIDWGSLRSAGILGMFSPSRNTAGNRDHIVELVTGARAENMYLGAGMDDPIIERFGRGDGLQSTDPRDAFWRVLGVHVRRLQLATVPEAIRIMTSDAAQRAGIADRGQVVAGAAADLIAFEFEAVPNAYEWTNDPPPWLRLVLINGIPVIRDGRSVGASPGLVLPKP